MTSLMTDERSSCLPADFVDRGDREQREPEGRHVLQEPLKLRLIADGAGQHRVAVLVLERHAFEGDVVAQLTFDDEPVSTGTHATSMARSGSRSG